MAGLYLDVADDGSGLVFNEFDSDLSDTAPRASAAEDFGYFG